MARTAAAWLLAWLVGAGAAHAQPRRPFIADPYHAHLVEGRVVYASGAPAAGVVVERVQGPGDTRPYSAGAYREVTDARGAFRFTSSGLGLGTGRTWYLAARPDRCPIAVVTVHLERGPAPPHGREGDVATGVVLRLPPCPPR